LIEFAIRHVQTLWRTAVVTGVIKKTEQPDAEHQKNNHEQPAIERRCAPAWRLSIRPLILIWAQLVLRSRPRRVAIVILEPEYSGQYIFHRKALCFLTAPVSRNRSSGLFTATNSPGRVDHNEMISPSIIPYARPRMHTMEIRDRLFG